MAIYENRLLFRQIKTDNTINIALESVWAYTVQMGDSHPIPGRYRIRILNIELVDAEALTPAGTHLLCVLEKWTNEGWMECLEYMASTPEEDFYEIEDEDSLVNMFIKNIKFREYDEESLPKSEPIEL